MPQCSLLGSEAVHAASHKHVFMEWQRADIKEVLPSEICCKKPAAQGAAMVKLSAFLNTDALPAKSSAGLRMQQIFPD
jgi:hypothetical protein